MLPEKKKILAQGAEAIIYKDGDKLIKDRIKKNYRLPEIDERLRKQRTKEEAKLISTASRIGVPVPQIFEVEKNKLEIAFIDGVKVRDWLDSDEKGIDEVCKQIGESLNKLHKSDIIHGDLTTSNLIKNGDKIYFIDFGLGNFSQRIEDKAVDLHLFKECLRSKHYKIWEKCWNAFVAGYQNQDVLERLKIVEARGRYKKP